jgi:hypothetical protein
MADQTSAGMRAPDEPWIEVTSPRRFAAWLAQQQVGLAFTTYQAGKLFVLGRHPDGRLTVTERTFDRCTGLWADAVRLLKREVPLPIGRSVELACQMLEALGYAHGHGSANRDGKPANLRSLQEPAADVDRGAEPVVERVVQGEQLAQHGRQGPLRLRPQQPLPVLLPGPVAPAAEGVRRRPRPARAGVPDVRVPHRHGARPARHQDLIGVVGLQVRRRLLGQPPPAVRAGHEAGGPVVRRLFIEYPDRVGDQGSPRAGECGHVGVRGPGAGRGADRTGIETGQLQVGAEHVPRALQDPGVGDHGTEDVALVRQVRQAAAARLRLELRAGHVAFLSQQRAHPPAPPRQQLTRRVAPRTR